VGQEGEGVGAEIGSAETSPRYRWQDLAEWTRRVLEREGVPAEDAALVGRCLVHANLRGVDTHGVTRLPIYVKRLRLGLVNPRPEVRVVAEAPAGAVVDGDNGLGMVVGTRAMEEAIRRARAAGSSWVAVRNSNHFGACAYYVMLASAAGMVGIAMTNGEALMAPWGGVTPYLSTNPIAFAVPGGREGDVVLDFATSVSAAGRILLAHKRGERIPLGWITDRRGRPTDDPEVLLRGEALMVPMGGHKGYGLALMIDVLSGLLGGAAFGPHVGAMYWDFSKPQNVGHLFGALDVGRFVPLDVFRARLDQMVREVRACERADGVERIAVPGEIEAETQARREREGVPLPTWMTADLVALGEEVRLPFPRPMG
ncbi:MAG TPA: Ldh family oxidoreductase, partial [Chloroflexota bacterium]